MGAFNAPKPLAQEVIRLSTIYNLDWRIFAALINSESSYNINIKHNHPQVIGLSGWHTGFWEYPDLDRKNLKHQLEAGARTLSVYLQKSKGNYKRALWCYKGLGANGLGLRQAKQVLKSANKLSSF